MTKLTLEYSELYASGGSETVMGEAIKQLGWKREEFVINTKIFFGTGGPPPNCSGLSRKHVREGFQASLGRLQLDYVDIVLCHRPDPETPMEEVVRMFSQLINDGKALYWGTSEWSAFEIEHAMHMADKYNLIAPVVEQPQYNMLTRDRLEVEFAPLYALYGLGTTIWSPLASGVLTGKYNDSVPSGSRLSEKENRLLAPEIEGEEGKKTLDKVRKLVPIAKKVGCKPAQLALAWTLKNPHVSSTILGASKPEQVYENVKSLEFVDKLTSDIMNEIDEILGNKKPIPLRR